MVQETEFVMKLKYKFKYHIRAYLSFFFLTYYVLIPQSVKHVPDWAALIAAVSFLSLHSFLQYKLVGDKNPRRIEMLGNGLDLTAAHVAWLADPILPPPLFFFVIIALIGNGMVSGRDGYRSLAKCCLIASPTLLVVRMYVFGWHWPSLFLFCLGAFLISCKYLILCRAALINQQAKQNLQNRDKILWIQATAGLKLKEKESILRRRLKRALIKKQVSDTQLKLQMATVESVKNKLRQEKLFRKEVEKEGIILQEQLFQSSKLASLGTFVACIAHEINTPVTFLSLNGNLMKQFWKGITPILDDRFNTNQSFRICNMEYPEVKKRIPILLDNITEAADRVTTMMNDLKNYVNHRSSDTSGIVNINQAVEKALTFAISLNSKFSHVFVPDYHHGIPAIRGNQIKIEQVVFNLIINAFQAMEIHKHNIHIKTGFDADKKMVFISVRDQGKGMSKQMLSKVKKPFFSTGSDQGGLGLGLTITDKIVRDHGGFLEFSSQPGKGTTAMVFIPSQPTQQESEESPTNQVPVII